MRNWIRTACLLVAALCLLLTAGLADSPLPRLAFHDAVYIGHLGRQCTIAVSCRAPQLIAPGKDTFELRDHRGTVLARAQWHDPNGLMTFRVTVTEAMLGGHRLSVWRDGVQLTAEESFAAFSDLSVPRVTQLEPEVPAVALTIVCGGKSDQVEAVLAVLEKHGVKATFFMNGRFLEASTQDALRIRDLGHEIGSHGYYHSHMPAMTSYPQMRSMITRVNTCFEELLGVYPRLFRAPFSDTNEKVTALCRAEGQEDVMWNIDSRDWMEMYGKDPEELLRRVTGPEAVSGSVIQFHVNGYNTPAVLDAAIACYVQDRGYRVVTVGELMALSGRELPPMPD